MVDDQMTRIVVRGRHCMSGPWCPHPEWWDLGTTEAMGAELRPCPGCGYLCAVRERVMAVEAEEAAEWVARGRGRLMEVPRG